MEACCFTGHRHLPMGEEKDRLRDRCEAAVRHAYTLGCRRFYAGGALGFDMLAAAIVCRLRDTEYPDMSLHLLLPCKDQEAKWGERDKLRYTAMLSLADTCVSYTSGKLTYADVNTVLGGADFNGVAKFCEGMLTGDAGQAFDSVEEFLRQGKSVGVLVKDVMNFLNACMVARTCRNGKEILAMPDFF